MIEEMLLGLLKEKESFLTSNKLIAGKDQNLDAGNFKALYDFYSASDAGGAGGYPGEEPVIVKLKEEQEKINQQIKSASVRQRPPSRCANDQWRRHQHQPGCLRN